MAATVGGWLGFAEVVALKDFALAGDLRTQTQDARNIKDYFEHMVKKKKKKSEVKISNSFPDSSIDLKTLNVLFA